jgi:hypothetical protein
VEKAANGRIVCDLALMEAFECGIGDRCNNSTRKRLSRVLAHLGREA